GRSPPGRGGTEAAAPAARLHAPHQPPAHAPDGKVGPALAKVPLLLRAWAKLHCRFSRKERFAGCLWNEKPAKSGRDPNLISISRRGGRVAEGGGLLTRCTVKSCTQGSNPCLSARLPQLRDRLSSMGDA